MHIFPMVRINGSSQIVKKSLVVGAEIANELGLNNGQTIFFRVGQSCVQLKVKINNSRLSARQFSLNPQVLKNLGIKEDREYGFVGKANSINIGPVIGIMADRSADPRRPYRNQSYFISNLIKQSREIGAICFVFSSEDIDFATGKIKGYYHSNNSWKAGSYPFPDVIYARYKGHSPQKNNMRNKLIKTGCEFINPAILGKWRCYKILAENAELKTYLPDTRLITNFKSIAGMLNKYKTVYLKPVSGSQGESIIRVSQSGIADVYEYQYQLNKHQVRGTARSIKELQIRLKRVMGKQNYIVQQQINLLRVHNSLADMRVMVQKDESGQWLITGRAFRIGKSGSITSNISGGGRACKVNDVLVKHFTDPRDQARISAEIDHLALRAALAIEKNYSPIGELGIDIGLDKDGCLWFIEANLKPARRVFSLIGANENRLLSVQRPLLYARYLAGFHTENRNNSTQTDAD